MPGVDLPLTVGIDEQSKRQTENTIDQLRNYFVRSIDDINKRLSSNSSLVKLPQNPGISQDLFGKATQSTRVFTQATNQATQSVASFGERVGFSAARLNAYLLPAGLIFQISKGFSVATSSVIELNTEITHLTQLMGGSISKANDLAETVAKLGAKYGGATGDIAKSAETLIKSAGQFQGDGIKKALDSLSKTTLLPGFGDLESTTKGAIGALNAFGLGANQLNDVIDITNTLTKDLTLNSDDLFKAIEGGGASFRAVGGNFREYAALVAAAQQLTQESGSTIGSSLKTLSLQITKPEVVQFLDRFVSQRGGSIRNQNGQLKGIADLFLEIGKATRGLNPEQIAKVFDSISGARQTPILSSLIQDIAAGPGGLNVVSRAFDDIGKSSGSANRDVQIGLQSIESKLKQVSGAFGEAFEKIAENKQLQKLVGTLADLGEALAKILESSAKVVPGLVQFGAIFGAIELARAIPDIRSGVQRFVTRGRFGNPNEPADPNHPLNVTKDLLSATSTLNRLGSLRSALSGEEQEVVRRRRIVPSDDTYFGSRPQQSNTLRNERGRFVSTQGKGFAFGGTFVPSTDQYIKKDKEISSSLGFVQAFGTAKNAATDGFIDAMFKRVQNNQPIERIGGLENKLRDAQKAGLLKTREDIATIVNQKRQKPIINTNNSKLIETDPYGVNPPVGGQVIGSLNPYLKQYYNSFGGGLPKIDPTNKTNQQIISEAEKSGYNVTPIMNLGMYGADKKLLIQKLNEQREKGEIGVESVTLSPGKPQRIYPSAGLGFSSAQQALTQRNLLLKTPQYTEGGSLAPFGTIPIEGDVRGVGQSRIPREVIPYGLQSYIPGGRPGYKVGKQSIYDIEQDEKNRLQISANNRVNNSLGQAFGPQTRQQSLETELAQTGNKIRLMNQAITEQTRLLGQNAKLLTKEGATRDQMIAVTGEEISYIKDNQAILKQLTRDERILDSAIKAEEESTTRKLVQQYEANSLSGRLGAFGTSTANRISTLASNTGQRLKQGLSEHGPTLGAIAATVGFDYLSNYESSQYRDLRENGQLTPNLRGRLASNRSSVITSDVATGAGIGASLSLAGGTELGAAIGTAILPGIGSAVGAVAGGLVSIGIGAGIGGLVGRNSATNATLGDLYGSAAQENSLKDSGVEISEVFRQLKENKGIGTKDIRIHSALDEQGRTLQGQSFANLVREEASKNAFTIDPKLGFQEFRSTIIGNLQDQLASGIKKFDPNISDKKAHLEASEQIDSSLPIAGIDFEALYKGLQKTTKATDDFNNSLKTTSATFEQFIINFNRQIQDINLQSQKSSISTNIRGQFTSSLFGKSEAFQIPQEVGQNLSENLQRQVDKIVPQPTNTIGSQVRSLYDQNLTGVIPQNQIGILADTATLSKFLQESSLDILSHIQTKEFRDTKFSGGSESGAAVSKIFQDLLENSGLDIKSPEVKNILEDLKSQAKTEAEKPGSQFANNPAAAINSIFQEFEKSNPILKSLIATIQFLNNENVRLFKQYEEESSLLNRINDLNTRFVSIQSERIKQQSSIFGESSLNTSGALQKFGNSLPDVDLGGTTKDLIIAQQNASKFSDQENLPIIQQSKEANDAFINLAKAQDQYNKAINDSTLKLNTLKESFDLITQFINQRINADKSFATLPLNQRLLAQQQVSVFNRTTDSGALNRILKNTNSIEGIGLGIKNGTISPQDVKSAELSLGRFAGTPFFNQGIQASEQIGGTFTGLRPGQTQKNRADIIATLAGAGASGDTLLLEGFQTQGGLLGQTQGIEDKQYDVLVNIDKNIAQLVIKAGATPTIFSENNTKPIQPSNFTQNQQNLPQSSNVPQTNGPSSKKKNTIKDFSSKTEQRLLNEAETTGDLSSSLNESRLVSGIFDSSFNKLSDTIGSLHKVFLTLVNAKSTSDIKFDANINLAGFEALGKDQVASMATIAILEKFVAQLRSGTVQEQQLANKLSQAINLIKGNKGK